MIAAALRRPARRRWPPTSSTCARWSCPTPTPGADLPDLPFDVLDRRRGSSTAPSPADDLAGPEPPRHRRAHLHLRHHGPVEGRARAVGRALRVRHACRPRGCSSDGGGYYTVYPAFHVSGKSALYLSARYRGPHRDPGDVQPHRVLARHPALRHQGAPGWSARWRRCSCCAEPQPDDADTPLESVYMGPLIPQVEEFKARFGVRGRHRLRHDRDRRAPRLRRLRPRQHHQLRPAAARAPRTTRCASSTSTTARCRSATVGELVRAARRAVGHHAGLLPPARAHRRGVAQRVVPHRRRASGATRTATTTSSTA